MSVSISNSGVLRAFADDIAFYKAVFSDADLVSFQFDLDIIADWINSSGLRLNASKTKLLVMSRKKHPPTPTVTVSKFDRFATWVSPLTKR